jgi:AcrR family transcriptional regulator
MAGTPDDTRQRLLEAAGAVFAQKGFQAATVREICARADANVAAVNYHFGDKERLYIETVRYAHTSGHGDSPLGPPTDAPPEEKLRHYVHGMLSRLLDERRPAWHAALMTREMAQPSKACEELVESYIRANFEVLDGILQELLPEDLPAEERHLVGFSIVGQCIHFKVHRPIAALLVGEEELRGHHVERLADHITRFSLAAIGRGAPVVEPPRHDRAPSGVLHGDAS